MRQAQKNPTPASAVTKEKETSLPTSATFQQIVARAYQIYQERGDTPGSDVDGWLEAERQLNQTIGQ